MTKRKNILFILILAFTIGFIGVKVVQAAPTTIPIPKVNISVDQATTPQDYVDNIKLLVILTVLTLLPSFIMMTTSFVRIIVVLSLFKNAIGLQQGIPRQIIVGLALFLTFFIMAPTFNVVNKEAITPYLDNKITQQEAITRGAKPIRNFMLKQTRTKDLQLFLEVGNLEDTIKEKKDKDGKVIMKNGKAELNFDEVPLQAVVPSFMISELRKAFEMGFLLFIPFLIIDIIAGSVLMSMGMFMLPPVMVSLPFKLLLFILVDGWNLLVKALIMSFR